MPQDKPNIRDGARRQRQVTELRVVEGELAPDFTLASDSGDAVTLSSLRGKPVVLYFYPRDDSHSSN